MSGLSARTVAPPAFDGPPELMVDGDFRSPAPLDRRIASVCLRTTTNNPTEGYEVAVSAAFGTERITLKAGEFELETEFSLKSADIELAFIKMSSQRRPRRQRRETDQAINTLRT